MKWPYGWNSRNADGYLIESNHDVDFYAGSYAWRLKQRILSDLGHLPNEDRLLRPWFVQWEIGLRKSIWAFYPKRTISRAGSYDYGQPASQSGSGSRRDFKVYDNLTRYWQHHWQIYKKRGKCQLTLYMSFYNPAKFLGFPCADMEESQRTLICPSAMWTKPGTVRFHSGTEFCNSLSWLGSSLLIGKMLRFSFSYDSWQGTQLQFTAVWASFATDKKGCSFFYQGKLLVHAQL